MSEILTICGQRGGTGKTLTAVNLAVGLALYGKKTLLIDLDPLASATNLAGKGPYTEDVSHVLSGKASFMDAVATTDLNRLFLLPAGFDLFFAALRLAKLTSNEKMLRIFLGDADPDFEYIIIDAPSSWGYLSVAALTAADRLICPICPGVSRKPDFSCLLQAAAYIRKTHEAPVRIAGFLFNRCQDPGKGRAFLKAQNLEDIKDLVFKTHIPEDPEAKLCTMPLAIKDIKSAGTIAYMEFTKEILTGV